jgi:hypothetical protein
MRRVASVEGRYLTNLACVQDACYVRCKRSFELVEQRDFYAAMSVFISYSAADKALARQLAAQLNADGIGVWDVEQEVLPGDNLSRKVGEALEESEAVVVLLSPSALRSRGVRSEIEFALGSKKLRNRLFPVLVRPVRAQRIPWILRKLKDPSLLSIADDPIGGSKRVAKTLRRFGIGSASRR